MKHLILLLTLITASHAATMTTFTRPGYTTVNAMGYSNGIIVGFNESNQGFIYDVTNETWNSWPDLTTVTIDGTAYNNRPRGIDGQYIVGQAANNQIGYFYDIYTDTATNLGINLPQGVSGSLIVGSHNNESSFMYDIATQDVVIFEHPSGSLTKAWDIDGNLVVGEYGNKGFIYNNATQDPTNSANWTTIQFPGASRTNVQGISGDYISGFYTLGGTKGFLYNFVTDVWTTIPNPDSGSTFLQARSVEQVGDTVTVVGSYRPLIGGDTGFIYTIPEPSAMVLVLGSLVPLLRRRR